MCFSFICSHEEFFADQRATAKQVNDGKELLRFRRDFESVTRMVNLMFSNEQCQN